MRHSQSHVPQSELQDRCGLAQLYVELTHIMHGMAFPKRMAIHGDMETMLVLMCVFIADCEGRPASATKIAVHANMPRATVYRKLEELIHIGKIIRVGRTYCYANGAVTPDPQRKLAKVLDRYAIGRVSKMDGYKLAI